MIEFVTVVPGDAAGISAIHELLLEYQEDLGIDLCFQDFNNELQSLPGKYAPPSGELILVRLDGAPVASGAIRDLGQGICELKRIFVRPEARRMGIARAISERLLESARAKGYRAMRLDTLKRLTTAIAMYERLGFVYIDPYNDGPEEEVVYMEKNLSSPAAY